MSPFSWLESTVNTLLLSNKICSLQALDTLVCLQTMYLLLTVYAGGHRNTLFYVL